MKKPESDSLRLDFAGASDVGMLRENNEDAWWAGELADEPEGWQEAHSGTLAVAAGVWLAVCDGLGGANAGEVASRMAIRETHRHLAEGEHGRVSLARAHEALVHTNDALNQVTGEHPAWVGMGSTISYLWCASGGAILGQVGDSRIYRLRQERMEELSPDHSPVGRMRQNGRLTEAEARVHPSRHVIDQCLGGDDPGLMPDCLPVDLRSGDVLLLCSDGLTDGVSDAEIRDLLLEVAADLRAPEMAVKLLIKSANRLSGRDNVTVLLVRIKSAGASED